MVKNVLKKNEKRRKNNKGFSLVELIVVIAIMAVLVGVLAPQLIKYVEKSREATDIQNMDSIASTILSYYADDETDGGVTATISFSTGSAAGDTQVTAALTEAGLNSTALKGNWTTKPEMTYTNGKITYTAGEAKYYKLKSDKTGFEKK